MELRAIWIACVGDHEEPFGLAGMLLTLHLLLWFILEDIVWREHQSIKEMAPDDLLRMSLAMNLIHPQSIGA